jgi:DNA-binding transcriptional MerR regulator
MQRRTLDRAEALAEANEPEKGAVRGKRRGLGSMGRLAFKDSVPEVTLLPSRDLFRPSELLELCALRQTELKAIEKEFGEHFPDRTARPRVYTRHQVEVLLRIKHLFLEERLPADEVRRRLSEPVVRPLPVLPRPQLKAPAAEPPEPAPPVPVPPMAAALPVGTITALREELQAILTLCEEG